MIVDIKKLRARQKQARLRAANPEHYKAYRRAARQAEFLADPEKVRAQKRAWGRAATQRRLSKPESVFARIAKKAASWLRKREYTRQWRLDNRDRVNAVFVVAQRKRLSENVNSRIKAVLRTRINRLVSGTRKSGSPVRDLGLTVNDFRAQIALQFQPGMTWEAWGTSFELDHVYPLAAANLEDRVEFRAVANWRNYQPLTPDENKLKGDKVTDAARERFEVLANFLEVV